MPDPEIERAQQLAAEAEHDSVTPERLVKRKIGFQRYRVHDDPLIRRLKDGEQPEFILHANSNTPDFNGPGAPDDLERSRRHRVVHLITDHRWLMVAGNADGDETLQIPLNEITAISYDTKPGLSSRVSNSVIGLELADAHYTIPVANDYSREDFEALGRYLRDNFGVRRGGTSVDPEEVGYTVAGKDSIEYDAKDVRNRLDRLPDEALEEANDVIAEADDVDALIEYLDKLIETKQSEQETLEDVVSEASSVGELRLAVETPGECAQRRAKETAEQGIDQARATLQDADPEEVGEWGTNLGAAAVPIAAAAPGPTTGWMLLSILASSSAGAVASANPESPLAKINPRELAAEMNALTEVGQSLADIDGEAAGAALGLFSYIGRNLAPEEYAEWVLAADPEMVLAGANAGAAFAGQSEVAGSRTGGIAVGAATGVLGSYTRLDGEEALKDVLDKDLYEAYRAYQQRRKALEQPTSTESG